MAIACMVNTDAYATGVPTGLAAIITSSALAGLSGAAVTLIARRNRR